MPINVEGGEFVIRSQNGDIAIVPQKFRVEVEDMINSKCFTCLEKFIASLPQLKTETDVV